MKSAVKRFRLLEIIAARVIRKRKIEEKVRSFALREDEAIWKAIDCQHRLQNSPYLQRVTLGRDAKNTPHTPYGRVRLARVRLLRHALPISLLILGKKPTVLQSIVTKAKQNAVTMVS